jgi:hypothetical protein
MGDFLIFISAVLIWFFLQTWLLPKMGVST